MTDSSGPKESIDSEYHKNWRIKDRTKTVSAALIACLNIGVDPPDVVKTNPCAKLECWIDPTSMTATKALETIGKNLQQQYEFWQPRARYKLSLDPTVADLQKLCAGLRKNSKDDRMLFHYNGHGVPRPTANGEIWAFNKQFTQYIPVSMQDIHQWTGSPAIYVYDCSSAANALYFMEKILPRGESTDIIQIAATDVNEHLPMNPIVPADILTSCLTTPIEIAIRSYVLQKSVIKKIPINIALKIPGRLNDRKSPLGELNWIFTAITDTIAWQSLPKDLFHRLFRQDLLVASLFRNYLLAERILKSFGVNPVTSPRIPNTWQHPLWDTWDFVLDACLTQIPVLLKNPKIEYIPNNFFKDYLKSFQVWLETGNVKAKSPDQLPILLQVLLSQTHRYQALKLFDQCMSLGDWAVEHVMSVGMFPYVLKLLQSPSSELHSVLLSIWVKIFQFDPSVRLELLKDECFMFFIKMLQTAKESEIKVKCLFALSCFVRNCTLGQNSVHKKGIMEYVVKQIEEDSIDDKNVYRWAWIFIGNMCEGNIDIKYNLINICGLERVFRLLDDDQKDTRCIGAYVLASLLVGSLGSTMKTLAIEHSIVFHLLKFSQDGCVNVRTQIVYAFGNFVDTNMNKFLMTAYEFWEEEKAAHKHQRKAALATVYSSVWKCLLILSVDSSSEVAKVASLIVDQVHMKFILPNQIPKERNKKLTKSSSKYPISDSASIRSLSVRNPSSISMLANPNLYQRPNDTQSLRSVSQLSFEFSNISQSDMSDVDLSVCSQKNKFPLQSSLPQNYFRREIYQDEGQAWRESLLVEYKKSIEVWKNKDIKTHKIDEQIAILENDSSSVKSALFHPYNSAVVVSDDKNVITVWDWDLGKKVNGFRNYNPRETFISDLKLSLDSDPRLMVASSDGVLRVWKDVVTLNTKLDFSWIAVPDLSSTSGGAGFVFEPQKTQILAGGDTDTIRIWDLGTMKCKLDIESTEKWATCFNWEDENIFSVGFTDGLIAKYDKRTRTKIQEYSEHEDWIVNLEQGIGDVLLSASTGGKIKMFDRRNTKPCLDLEFDSGLSCLSVSKWAPLMVCGWNDQGIKLIDFDGNVLSTLRYHDGFLGQRLGPTSTVNMHPYKMMFLAGSSDSLISVYGNQE